MRISSSSETHRVPSLSNTNKCEAQERHKRREARRNHDAVRVCCGRGGNAIRSSFFCRQPTVRGTVRWSAGDLCPLHPPDRRSTQKFLTTRIAALTLPLTTNQQKMQASTFTPRFVVAAPAVRRRAPLRSVTVASAPKIKARFRRGWPGILASLGW